MNNSIPVPDFEVSTEIVLKLIADQSSQFSNWPIRFVMSGWDNYTYRLGNDLAIRLPRRKEGAELILNESIALQQLSALLPIAIPKPMLVGSPTAYYPCHWTIVPWFAGEPADACTPAASEVGRLVNFLQSLHSISIDAAEFQPYQAPPLSSRAESVGVRLARVKGHLAEGAMLEWFWQEVVKVPTTDSPLLIHADLHPMNVIINDLQIEAVIDWSDIAVGDAAADLASLWMLFEDYDAIEKGMSQYGASHTLVRRSLAWALFFGAIILDTGIASAHPRQTALGLQLCNRLPQFIKQVTP